MFLWLCIVSCEALFFFRYLVCIQLVL